MHIMKDEKKTKSQLLSELFQLRQSVGDLKNLEGEILRLKKNRDKFTKAFLQNTIPMGISTIGEGKFVDVNQAFLRLFGFKRDEVIGNTSTGLGLLTEQQRTIFIDELNKKGRLENLELQVGTKTGKLLYGMFNSVMVNIDDEKHLLTVVIDITDRKRTLEALKESEERYRLLAEGANDVIFRMRIPDGKYEYVSPSASRVLGYNPEDLYNNPLLIRKAVHPDWREYFEKQWQAILDGKEPHRFVFQIIDRRGDVRWHAQHNSFIKDSNGKLIALQGIVRDITEQRRLQEEIAASEKNYREIFNGVPVGLFQSSVEGRYLKANDHLAEILGYDSPEDLIRSITDLGTQIYADQGQRDEALHLLREYGFIANFEAEFRRKDGRIIWGSLSVRAVRDTGGDILFFEGSSKDITERKKIEHELIKIKNELEERVIERTQKLEAINQAFMRELRERNRLEAIWKKADFITNSSRELMTLINRHYIFEAVNDAYCRAHGKSRDEIIGKTAIEIWGEKRFNKFIKPKIDCCLKGEVVDDEDWVEFPRFGRRYFAVTYSPYSQSEGKVSHVSVITHDITERKLALEAVKISELKYRNLFNQATDGIMMMQIDGSSVTVNESFAKIHGYGSPKEMEHLKLSDIDTPETARLAPERLRRLLAGESMRFEVEHYHKDGHTIWLNVSCNVVNIEDQRYYLGFHQDITEQKRAEKILRKQEQDLITRAKELEEANTALRVFFKQHSEDQKRVEEKLQLNVNELVMPYIEKLKKQNMGKQYLTYLELLELNLQNIVSPFMKNLSATYQNLTPQEIQIAEMIRQGKSSQEMAAVLNLSVRTVNTHRNNMRKKLKLRNRAMNLRSYLLSLT
jgi:PAS domain S-box-containing protein